MNLIEKLFDNNAQWSQRMQREDPRFFDKLVRQQKPELLWIGCSDSRVPANEIVGLLPGELFVHRNVANQIIHTDLNALSVIEFAIEALKVKHIIVCGHYRCGGVAAAITGKAPTLVGHWLRHIRDVYERYGESLSQSSDSRLQIDILCELNVIHQARNVCTSPIVADAWERQQPICVHAWIYDISDGILRDLGFDVNGPADVEPAFTRAIQASLSKVQTATASQTPATPP